MKRTRHLLAAAAMLASLAASQAFAGEVVVRFIDPDRFTDLGTQRSDEAANMRALGAHLQQLGARLPAGQVLRVDVLDVDLAGYVRHGRVGDRRVASGRADAPHFQLRYSLESGGKVVKTGTEQLTDLDYIHGLAGGPAHGPLHYEKRLLTTWFNASFVPESQAAR
jgi:hypothetical protein